MKKLNRFFWFCAGAHIKTLKQYPTEQNKFTGIGATIFFTGLFAALSGGYALYFVFKGDTLDWLYALLFGLIWGAAIFNMDRYIVSSLNKNASSIKQLWQATPRILLAIMIGLVISRPIELKVFDKEIKDRLRVVYLNNQRAKIDTLNRSFEKKYYVEVDRLVKLKNQKDSLESGIKTDKQKLNFEIFGNKTNETSGVMGYGPYAKRKEIELQQRQTELDTLKNHIAKAENFIDTRKKIEGLLDEKIFTSKQLDSLANVAGFADRNRALGLLRTNTDGTEDESTANAITFIVLLFIFFECLPVFVKLMSQRGTYDVVIDNINQVDIHQSNRDKDFNINVIENIQETKIDSETEHKIKSIKAQTNNLDIERDYI